MSQMHRQMKEQLRSWVSDEQWVIQKKYIKDLEYYECVSDIFDNELFLKMNTFIQHGTTTTRAHCIQVSYLSYRIAKRCGFDYRSVARAGLLHDLYLYDWHTHCKETGNHFHGLTHPYVALKNAMKEFQLNEIEKDCIQKHMWPLTVIPPKYWEGYVIMYADKACTVAEVTEAIKNKVLAFVLPANV